MFFWLSTPHPCLPRPYLAVSLLCWVRAVLSIWSSLVRLLLQGCDWGAGQGTHTIWLTEAPQPPQGRWESSLLITAQRGNQREKARQKCTGTNYISIWKRNSKFSTLWSAQFLFSLFNAFTYHKYALLLEKYRKFTRSHSNDKNGLVCTRSRSKLFPPRAITSKVRDPSSSGSRSTGSGPSHWIQLFRDEPPCQKITTLTFWICFCGA